MDRLLSGIKGNACFVYLDDVIIFSKDIPEHAERLRQVLEKLRDANLAVNLEKCRFAQTEVKYLGHIVGKHGVATDPEKVTAIREYKTPKSAKEVRAFLGLVGNYRRFIIRGGGQAFDGPLKNRSDVRMGTGSARGF